MAQPLITNRAGDEVAVKWRNDRSVMEIIRDASFDELLALCLGCCTYATCHV